MTPSGCRVARSLGTLLPSFGVIRFFRILLGRDLAVLCKRSIDARGGRSEHSGGGQGPKQLDLGGENGAQWESMQAMANTSGDNDRPRWGLPDFFLNAF